MRSNYRNLYHTNLNLQGIFVKSHLFYIEFFSKMQENGMFIQPL